MKDDEFVQRLFGLINRAYEDGVPMAEVYGSLGMAQTKLEDDIQTALNEQRDLGSSGSDFRMDDDEKFF